MKLSENGLKLLKQLEGGFQAKAYKDSHGFSIGYGHFILPNESRLLKETINESVASVLLKHDVLKAENYVNAKRKDFTQNQFDALVIFVYNVGSWGTGFDAIIRQKKYSLLPDQWRKYNIASGKINQSLISRREKEISLFISSGLTSMFPVMVVLLACLFYFIR